MADIIVINHTNIMGAITKIRSSIVPVKLGDKLVTSFTISIIPLYYYIHFFVTLPDIFLPNSISYWINFAVGNFIAVNIVGNFVCIILSDTSAQAYIRSAKQIENTSGASPGCELCGTHFRRPPRTWHCVSCGTCILHRDHHCMFVGYCIGQYNRRFFVIFLLYMVLGTACCLYFTTQFLQKRLDIFIPTLVAQVICPPVILFLHPDSALHTTYLILYLVLIFATMMVCLLCVFNTFLIVRGIVGIEVKIGRKNLRKRTLVENITEVLGRRWYLIWLCPLISSDLPLEENFQL